MSLWTRIKNKWIGDDPNPQPSILDVLDSRGTVPLDADGEFDVKHTPADYMQWLYGDEPVEGGVRS